jgi:hypothetical protein
MKPTTLVTATLVAFLAGQTPAHAQFGSWNPVEDIGNAVQQAADAIAPITAPVQQGIETIHRTVPGVHIDPTRGANGLIVTTPGQAIDNVRQLPQTFQNNLIPFGTMLADAIKRGQARALPYSHPVPFAVRSALRGRISDQALAMARYSTDWGATQNGTIQQFLLANGHAVAVTLGGVIVFASPDDASSDNLELWEHELTHVEQYQRMGIDAFAQRYVVDYRSLESEAENKAARPRDDDSDTDLTDNSDQGANMQRRVSWEPTPQPERRSYLPEPTFTYCATPAGNSGLVRGGTVGVQCWVDTAYGRYFGIVQAYR